MKRLLFLTAVYVFLYSGIQAQQQDSLSQALYARARANMEEGAYKDAILEFNQLINSKFSDPDVYLNRGIAHYHLDEYESAVEDFEKASRNKIQTADLYGFQGMALYALKQNEQAAIALEKASNLGFKDPQAYFFLGNLKFKADRFTQAVTHYTKAEMQGESSAVLFNNRGKALLLLNKPKEGIADFGRALALEPTLVAAHRNSAEAHFQLEDWEASYDEYSWTIEQDPSFAEGYLKRGMAAFSCARYPEAIEDLKKAEARGSGNATSTRLIAQAHFNLGDYKNAAVYFDKVVRKDGEDKEAWELLGISLYRQGNFTNAAKALQSADAKSFIASGYLGMALYQAGKSEEAYEPLSKIVARDFLETDAYYFLGELQLKKREYSPAMSSFSRIIELDPENYRAYLHRAKAHVSLRESANIAEDLTKALAINSDTQTWREAGLIYFEAKKYEKAVTHLQKAGNEDFHDVAVNRAMAEVLFQQQDYQGAKPYYEALLLKGGDLRAIAFPMAVIYYRSQAFEQAYEWFVKAERSAPIPADQTYSFAHAAFLQQEYVRVIKLTDGLREVNAPLSISRMRAVSAFETQNYALALKESKTLELDAEIRRIGGLSAHFEKQPEQVISFLAGHAAEVETMEPLANAYATTGDRPAAIGVFADLIQLDTDNASYHLSKGKLYAALENYPLALEDLTRALDLDPNLTEAREQRGKIAFNLKEYTTAIEDFSRIKETDGSGELDYLLGMSYWYTNQSEAAIPFLETAYDSNWKKSDMAAILGSHYFDEKAFEKALDRLNQSIHLGNASEEVKRLRGHSHYALENYEMAVQDFKETPIESFVYNFEYGFSLYQLKNYTQSKKYLKKAAALNAADAETFYHLGNTEFQIDEYALAIAAYQQSIDNGMVSEILYNNYGKAHYLLEQYEEALPLFTKALALDQAYAKARMNRGMTYFNMGQYESSIEDLLQLDPEEFKQVNSMLAESYFEIADFALSLKYFNRCIDGGDKSADTYHKRARTLMALEQYPSALNDLNNAENGGKKDAEVYLDRARVNIYIGNDPAAMRDLNEAISLDPENPIAYYNRGYLRELQEKFNEAIVDYKKVIKLDPEDHRAYYSMANSMVSLGQVSPALDPIEKAISLKPEEPSYVKVKGNIAYRLDRKEEACGLWKEAVDMGDDKSNFYINQYCK